MLIIESEYGKIKTNPGWLRCPICGKHKVLRLEASTEAKDLPVFCKRCGKEIIMNISPEPAP